jgi:hypothetical protein
LRVIVVGVGGVGGWLVKGLAPMLEAADPGSVLMLVDGDTFEEKNLDRQDFFEYGWKAVSRANELQGRYPQTIIVAQPYFVVGESEGWPEEEGEVVGANQLLQNGDVVFATVDNHATRKVLIEVAAQFDDVDLFTGGNDDGYFGSTYHYQRRNGVDTIDSPFDWHPEMADPPDRNPGEMSCEERAAVAGGTQLLATNMAVSAFLLGRFHQSLILGEPDQAAEIFFDLGVGMARPYDRRPDDEGAEAVTPDTDNEVNLTETQEVSI